MSKSEVLHALYNQCKDVNFDEFYEIVSKAGTEEEAEFFRTITTLILQQRQRKVIKEKRF